MTLLARTTTILHVSKHISRVLPITPQAHSLHVAPEFELNYAALLGIVPNHDFGGRKLWMSATATQCQVIASKEHFYNAYSCVAVKFFDESDSLEYLGAASPRVDRS